MKYINAFVFALSLSAIAACSGDDDEDDDDGGNNNATTESICNEACDELAECSSTDDDDCDCEEEGEYAEYIGCEDEGENYYACLRDNATLCDTEEIQDECANEIDDIEACIDDFCDENPNDSYCE